MSLAMQLDPLAAENPSDRAAEEQPGRDALQQDGLRGPAPVLQSADGLRPVGPLLQELLGLLDQVAAERPPRRCAEALASCADPGPRQRREALREGLAELGALLVDALREGEGELLFRQATAALTARTRVDLEPLPFRKDPDRPTVLRAPACDPLLLVPPLEPPPAGPPAPILLFEREEPVPRGDHRQPPAAAKLPVQPSAPGGEEGPQAKAGERPQAKAGERPQAGSRPPVEVEDAPLAGNGLLPVEHALLSASAVRPAVDPTLPMAPAPPEEQAPPPALPVQVTPALLADLQRSFDGHALRQEARAAEHQAASRCRGQHRMVELVGLLGRTPRSLDDPGEVATELRLLERAVPGPPSPWAESGREANHALTSWVTARARAVQEAASALGLHAEVRRSNRLFPHLSRHSASSQPGSVWGLARAHRPRRASWLQDAQAEERRVRGLVAGPLAPATGEANLDDALRQLTEEVRSGLPAADFCARVATLLGRGLAPTETRLVRLAMPYLPALDGGGFGKLRRAVLKALEAEVPPAPEQEQLPADWPCWSQTRGQRAALLGGIPRAERRKRLQEVFGFASLEWLPDIGIRRVHALTERMQAGSLDLVIVLRAFTSHTVSAKAFEAETPQCRVILADNYGVNQVRLGLERFCEERANA